MDGIYPPPQGYPPQGNPPAQYPPPGVYPPAAYPPPANLPPSSYPPPPSSYPPTGNFPPSSYPPPPSSCPPTGNFLQSSYPPPPSSYPPPGAYPPANQQAYPPTNAYPPTGYATPSVQPVSGKTKSGHKGFGDMGKWLGKHKVEMGVIAGGLAAAALGLEINNLMDPDQNSLPEVALKGIEHISHMSHGNFPPSSYPPPPSSYPPQVAYAPAYPQAYPPTNAYPPAGYATPSVQPVSGTTSSSTEPSWAQTQIHHKSHAKHPLVLLSTNPVPNGVYICDGCGERGNDSGYYCSTCNYVLHVECVSLQEQVRRADHQHPLTLYYSNPYKAQGMIFECDVCHYIVPESSWVYWCSDCDYGTHIKCVRGMERSKEVVELEKLVATQQQLSLLQQQAQMNAFSTQMSQMTALGTINMCSLSSQMSQDIRDSI